MRCKYCWVGIMQQSPASFKISHWDTDHEAENGSIHILLPHLASEEDFFLSFMLLPVQGQSNFF